MEACPDLATDRLTLRAFRPADASCLARLAGARAIAAWTLLPHPYDETFAADWIATQQRQQDEGTARHFAITLAQEGILIGSIGLEIVPAHRHARLGYWLGVDYWRQGYATEAVRAVLAYGFEHLELNRIYAPHFSGNDASGRVLRKVGMTHEGRMREHYIRFGRLMDLELYGILKRDFTGNGLNPPAATTH